MNKHFLANLSPVGLIQAPSTESKTVEKSLSALIHAARRGLSGNESKMGSGHLEDC